MANPAAQNNSAQLDIWRQIPPEEKFALIAKAQGVGISACLIVVVVACTMAVGLKLGWLMWASFATAPFVFQFAAGRAWRNYKPRVTLEYLGARSAARRFAFTSNAQELDLALIFRGQLTELFDNDHIQEALEKIIENNDQAEVWIAIFRDTVVMLRERPGGASCEFLAPINERLSVAPAEGQQAGEYKNGRELVLTVKDKEKHRAARRYKLTSSQPAALVVFEQKLTALLKEAKNRWEIPVPLLDDEGDRDDA